MYKRHGHKRKGWSSPTYKSWSAAKTRCFNRTNHNYRLYGGRGITMCSEWEADFTNFLKDMGERPEGRTLDRIDNEKGYEPGNCRWATNLEQGRNKRPRPLAWDKFAEVKRRHEGGERVIDLAAEYGVARQTIRIWINLHNDLLRDS